MSNFEGGKNFRHYIILFSESINPYSVITKSFIYDESYDYDESLIDSLKDIYDDDYSRLSKRGVDYYNRVVKLFKMWNLIPRSFEFFVWNTSKYGSVFSVGGQLIMYNHPFSRERFHQLLVLPFKKKVSQVGVSPQGNIFVKIGSHIIYAKYVSPHYIRTPDLGKPYKEMKKNLLFDVIIDKIPQRVRKEVITFDLDTEQVLAGNKVIGEIAIDPYGLGVGEELIKRVKWFKGFFLRFPEKERAFVVFGNLKNLHIYQGLIVHLPIENIDYAIISDIGWRK